jgi:hypothetical protein
MARTDMAVDDLTLSGVAPTYHSAHADDNKFDNPGGDVIIHVKNASGSGLTVTVVNPASYHGVAFTDLSIYVCAGTDKLNGPFDPAIFNQSDTSVHVNWSATTSITCAAIRVPHFSAAIA